MFIRQKRIFSDAQQSKTQALKIFKRVEKLSPKTYQKKIWSFDQNKDKKTTYRK